MPRKDYVALGYRAERDGKLVEAERLYERAIAAGDDYGYNNLAQLRIEDGRLAEAERLFRKGVRAGDGLAAKNLALFLLEEGRDKDAQRAIEVARRMQHAPTRAELAGSRAYRRTSMDER